MLWGEVTAPPRDPRLFGDRALRTDVVGVFVGAGLVPALMTRGTHKGRPYQKVLNGTLFMTFNPDIHHRRTIRLRNFDYASAGAYFITICAQGRECLFGEVFDGAMVANDAGRMLESVWSGLPERFSGIELDVFVIMPNHAHCILFLVGAPLVGALSLVGAVPVVVDQNTRAGTRPAPTTVGDIVGAFKSVTTHEFSKGVTKSGWASFPGRLWQRNYFERVIRNDAELDKFRTYIMHNPDRWAEDEENPLIPMEPCPQP